MGNKFLSDLKGTLLSTFKIAKSTLDSTGLTAQRTHTLPDTSGTLALTAQITTRSILSISAPTTAPAVANTDYVYLISGTTTLTLPTAVGNTNRYTAKNVGVAVVSIASTSSETFDGTASPITMPISGTQLEFVSDGANWKIG